MVACDLLWGVGLAVFCVGCCDMLVTDSVTAGQPARLVGTTISSSRNHCCGRHGHISKPGAGTVALGVISKQKHQCARAAYVAVDHWPGDLHCSDSVTVVSPLQLEVQR